MRNWCQARDQPLRQPLVFSRAPPLRIKSQRNKSQEDRWWPMGNTIQDFTATCATYSPPNCYSAALKYRTHGADGRRELACWPDLIDLRPGDAGFGAAGTLGAVSCVHAGDRRAAKRFCIVPALHQGRRQLGEIACQRAVLRVLARGQSGSERGRIAIFGYSAVEAIGQPITIDYSARKTRWRGEARLHQSPLAGWRPSL